MGEKFDPSPTEIAEHERAALEITRLRRKGIPCHLESHPEGSVSHVDVVRDTGIGDWTQSDSAISLAASRKDG